MADQRICLQLKWHFSVSMYQPAFCFIFVILWWWSWRAPTKQGFLGCRTLGPYRKKTAAFINLWTYTKRCGGEREVLTHRIVFLTAMATSLWVNEISYSYSLSTKAGGRPQPICIQLNPFSPPHKKPKVAWYLLTIGNDCWHMPFSEPLLGLSAFFFCLFFFVCL